MESFGSRLRAQRERQQVTLAAIAAETKISVALLDGLERDDLSRWPGGIFKRAYIRAYAHAVGLEPAQVQREFLEHYPDPEPLEGTLPIGTAADATVETDPGPTSRLGSLLAGLSVVRSLQEAFTRPSDGLRPAAAPSSADVIPDGEVFAEPTQNLLAVPPVPAATTAAAAPDPPDLGRDLMSIARLCTALGCTRDHSELLDALAEAAHVLNARGVIVWAWDPIRAVLCPVVTHGYSDAVLERLPRVGRNSDNAIAGSFRSMQIRVVKGAGAMTGAFVTPLLTPSGCVGALAFEFTDGGEERESVRAFATILSAQVSTLVAGSRLVEALSVTDVMNPCAIAAPTAILR